MSQSLIQYSLSPYWDNKYKKILQEIRDTYGNTTQILVSNEELCELAAVCAKFPRYEDPAKAKEMLHSRAIDEVADVMIILDHIINIFELDRAEVLSRIDGKIDRISRWLSTSNSQEQTTIDRDVKAVTSYVRFKESVTKAPCGKCTNFGDFRNMNVGAPCNLCVQDPYCGFSPREDVSVNAKDNP